MGVVPDAQDEEGWDHDTNWRGLGLTDPIKNVEVSLQGA